MTQTNAQKQANYRKRVKQRNAECIEIAKAMLKAFDTGHDRMDTFGLSRIIELLERN